MRNPTAFPKPDRGFPYFLTGVTNELVEAEIGRFPIGLLATPAGGSGARVPTYTAAGAPWAADNGCFAQGEKFDPAKWLSWLDLRPRGDCLFAVLPDVLGDHEATLARSLPYVETVRSMGFPAAYVAQNGATPENLPWHAIDVLFVGGDKQADGSEWKLSEASARCMTAARSLGRWVHVGRVNSGKRYSWSALNGADSVDGTFLKFGRKGENLPRLLSWLRPFAPPAEELLLAA